MKKIIIISCLLFISISTFAQLNGSFNLGNDGRIYFYLQNPSQKAVKISYFANNVAKQDSRYGKDIVLPNHIWVFGPNVGWVWEQGEIMTITLANGQSCQWVCPQSDNGGYQNQYGYDYGGYNYYGDSGNYGGSNNSGSSSGSGRSSKPKPSLRRCPHCRGTGIYECHRGYFSYPDQHTLHDCPQCGVRHEMERSHSHKCTKCKGEGYH